jgi:predicted DNA-binding transcriptional regulator YafY
MVALAISTTVYEYRAVVRVEASAAEMAARIAPYEGTVTSDADGHVILELGADDFTWLASYLIGLGLNFEVIEPEDFRDQMALLGQRLIQEHQPTTRVDP